MKELFASPLRHTPVLDDIKNANRQDIIDMIHGMTANAADYTFYFTGAIDEKTFVPLMEQYIATLPANAKKASKGYKADPAFEFSKANGTVTETTKMETPQSWVFIAITANMPYTAKNKALVEVSAQVLSKRLLNKVREEMGATYSIGAYGQMYRVGETNTVYQIAFPMKPEMKDEALDAIKEIVDAMTSTVTDEELKPAIEFMQKDAAEKLRSNEEWGGTMSATSLNGVQTFLNAAETAASITPADVQSFMKDVLSQDRYRVIVLDPEGAQAIGD